MENETSFDLDAAIGKWHDSLVHSSGLSAEELEELQLHLRDSVSALRNGGLSDEEAWIIAQMRLGQRDALKKEFAKVTSPTKAMGSAWERLIAAIQTPRLNTSQILQRIILMERNIVLPVKAVAITILLFSFYSSPWFTNVSSALEIGLETMQRLLWAYVCFNVIAAGVFIAGRHVWPAILQQLVFAMTLLDGVFILTLAILVGDAGALYWLFPALFVRTAVSVPRLSSQILLWLTLIICFAIASFIESSLAHNLDDATRFLMAYPMQRETQPILLRLALLLSVAVCCFSVQVLLHRNRAHERLSPTD